MISFLKIFVLFFSYPPCPLPSVWLVLTLKKLGCFSPYTGGRNSFLVTISCIFLVKLKVIRVSAEGARFNYTIIHELTVKGQKKRTH